MQAVTITRHGPPSVLEVRTHPDPVAGPGQIRVGVRAAGLNFAETSARQGLYPDAPKPPCIVGYEVAGVVEQVGEGVTRFKLGDRVLGMTRFGGHAEQAAVDEGLALAMPEQMSFAEGAALPVTYLTAHHMLFHTGTVHPRSTVLLHMAAGGVGIAVLQLLKMVPELTIIGTASSSKHDYIRKLGCTHPIDYRTQDYVAEVRRITNGRGADLILDPLGGADWRKHYDLLAPAGRLVAFGFANAQKGSSRDLINLVGQVVRIPIFSPMRLLNDNKSIQGLNLGHLWGEGAILKPQLERVVRLFSEGIVRPHIHAEVPFSKAAEAHEMLEQRKNVGKVVLTPG